MNGEYKPGELLTIAEIAKEICVDVSLVRKVISKLMLVPIERKGIEWQYHKRQLPAIIGTIENIQKSMSTVKAPDPEQIDLQNLNE